MKFRVKGIVPAMATPLKDKGQRVNFQVLDLLCDFLIDKGVTGLFVLGSTGEGVLFSMEERKEIAERVLKHVHGRVPVIVNCGHITTQGAIELAQHAASVGADAASVVFPYYYPLSAEDAMAHFIAVARSIPEFPMYVYYYRRGLEPEQTLQMSEQVPNLVGMKNGGMGYQPLLGHVMVMGEGFCILEGSEMLAYGALTLGVDGLISGVATAFPEPFVRLYQLVQDGKYEEARKEQALIYRLARVIYQRNPWARIKKSLQMRGIDVGRPRSPVGECSPEETEDLRTALLSLGLL
jgi:dihydrodipicolinate synthase/N-acetylneuraminate lyase